MTVITDSVNFSIELVDRLSLSCRNSPSLPLKTMSYSAAVLIFKKRFRVYIILLVHDV